MKRLLLTVLTTATFWGMAGDVPEADDRKPVLLQEDFGALPASATLPEGWWAEGSSMVAVKDGALVQNADPEAGATNPNSVVWIGQEFEGDIRFEADVTVLSAKGKVNDVVIFFLFSDPTGKPLHATREQRASGKQDLYTKDLGGYALFYWGKKGVTTPANIRLRDCPGEHLLLEANKHSIETARTYHVAVEKQGTMLRLLVDGQKLVEHELDKDEVANPVHAKGLIGLKTWNTSLRWDNIRVSRPR
jgi:hypothetical protein